MQSLVVETNGPTDRETEKELILHSHSHRLMVYGHIEIHMDGRTYGQSVSYKKMRCLKTSSLKAGINVYKHTYTKSWLFINEILFIHLWLNYESVKTPEKRYEGIIHLSLSCGSGHFFRSEASVWTCLSFSQLFTHSIT